MNKLKKDLIFTILMILIAVVLFMFKQTGMIVHIAISLVGVAVLVAYTIAAKKDWKIPQLNH